MPHPAQLTSLPCSCEQQGAESMEEDMESVVSFHHTNSGGICRSSAKDLLPGQWADPDLLSTLGSTRETQNPMG